MLHLINLFFNGIIIIDVTNLPSFWGRKEKLTKFKKTATRKKNNLLEYFMHFPF